MGICTNCNGGFTDYSNGTIDYWKTLLLILMSSLINHKGQFVLLNVLNVGTFYEYWGRSRFLVVVIRRSVVVMIEA